MNNASRVMLPESDVHFNDVRPYVELTPHNDYSQAPESSRDAFRDIKFGVRIHWGLYSEWELQQESWSFLKMSHEDRQKYIDLYKTFDPKEFDAEQWFSFFKKAGFKCFAFTSKHHDGFSLFDTDTRVKRRVNWISPGGPQIEECDLAYSVAESPFKRDIVGELCDAARKYGIKIDLYFSHPDWFDADFRPYTFHPLSVPDIEKVITKRELDEMDIRFDKRAPLLVHSITKDEKERMIARHRQQLTELLTKYGKIDMICLDMWLGADVWPDLRDTIKKLREIQPDVMLRARGIGNYGDYYCPEGFVPESKENTNMPWMVIYPLAETFSYDPNGGNYKGSEWVISNLVDAVAKGGNFMVGIGPDGSGRWHPCAVEQLEEVGKWLDVNGEAIYATRPRSDLLYKEDNTFFTCSKDGNYVYAISMGWPGRTLNLTTVRPKSGSKIRLLGHDANLKWTYASERGLLIDIPEQLQHIENLPCKTAYSFKIEVES
jgi:alpha-L-fucosidase